MTSLEIRRLEAADIPGCVRVHMRAFQGFFLTFLGERFLHVLYASISADPAGIGFVAELEGEILGFVIGSAQPAGLYTRLLRKRWCSFGWASFGALIKRPLILPRLLRAFTMPGQKKGLSNCGELMSIAVLPEAQGKKVGQLLVKAFLDESARRGLEQVTLITDRVNNDSTNRFYQYLGFSHLREYVTPEGRQMNEYRIALDPAAQEPPN